MKRAALSPAGLTRSFLAQDSAVSSLERFALAPDSAFSSLNATGRLAALRPWIGTTAYQLKARSAPAAPP